MAWSGLNKGCKGFGDRVELFEYEWRAYRRLIVAYWNNKRKATNFLCGNPKCNQPEIDGWKFERAHIISIHKGVVRHALTPDFLNRSDNLINAHVGECNDAVELNDKDIVDRLKNVYKRVSCPLYLPSYIQNLWTGALRENVFFPPEDILDYDLGFGQRMFLTKEEFDTYDRRTPNHIVPNKPIKEVCELCGSPGDKYQQLENAHKIPHAPGILNLGLTPSWLASDVNLVTAHRTRKGNFKCNLRAELSFENAMRFLKSLGVQDLPYYLPIETLALWKTL